MNDKHKIMLSISHKLNDKLTERKLTTGIDKLEIIRIALRSYLNLTDDEHIDHRVKSVRSKVKAKKKYGPEGELLD